MLNERKQSSLSDGPALVFRILMFTLNIALFPAVTLCGAVCSCCQEAV